MEKRILGRTGIWVSIMGVGTGQFGLFGRTTEAECVRLAHAAFDGGINLIDTADFYSFGEAETIAGRRDGIVLASKCGMPMSDELNDRGGSRRWINISIERSLKRLGTDCIDLYQLHQPDPATPIEETLLAMTDLVRAGKIRAFGLSNSNAAQITEAALQARLQGCLAPYAEQSAYSIFTRGPEADLLPACEKYGFGFLAYSPLDGGWLSGKYRRNHRVAPTPRHRLQPGKFDLTSEANAAKLDMAERLAELAAELSLSLSHMAIAFVLSHRAITCALIGGNRLDHVQAHLAGQDVRLSAETLDRIDAIVAPGQDVPEQKTRSRALQDPSLRRRQHAAPVQEVAVVDMIRRLADAETANKTA
jgi:aryl-alcohol dehydrogenase-like predicted oxidoreductase